MADLAAAGLEGDARVGIPVATGVSEQIMANSIDAAVRAGFVQAFGNTVVLPAALLLIAALAVLAVRKHPERTRTSVGRGSTLLQVMLLVMARPKPGPAGLIPIGEAARRFDLAASALRFYESRGLLTPAARDGGRRWYGRAELRRVAFLRTAQQLGANLDDIAALIHSNGTGWRDLVGAHIDHLRRQREWLDATLDTLHDALTCPLDHPLLECPHLIDTLDTWIDEPNAHIESQRGRPRIAEAGGRTRASARQRPTR
ncbi:MerR family transcriptional regulator [Actinomycetes bacterium KLBMP 9759]